MVNVALSSGLQKQTFGDDFNQSIEKVASPSCLLNLTFGGSFNQSIEKVPSPSGSRSLQQPFSTRVLRSLWTSLQVMASRQLMA